jgi:transposase InsO family protein
MITVRSSSLTWCGNILKSRPVEQEFIHVATPEENCFIEAYHSILEKQLLETVEFEDIEEALAVFNRWKIFYNERRRHGSLGQCPPKEVWDAYEKTNFAWVRRSGRGLRQGCNPPEIA